MSQSVRRWWNQRRSARSVARTLTAEFKAHATKQMWFGVKAHGRKLELTVWPVSGVDTFEFPARTQQEVDQAIAEFREIVARYLAGELPPFVPREPERA